MFIDIKNWKNKLSSKKFNDDKKEILKLINYKKNKKLIDKFSFLNQDNKLLNKKIIDTSNNFLEFDKILLIGTGGSSLGSKAILEVVSNDKIVFIENIDPNYVLKKINLVGLRLKTLPHNLLLQFADAFLHQCDALLRFVKDITVPTFQGLQLALKFR